MDLGDLLRLIVVGILLVIFSYAAVRAGSFAYFRTRLEYWRELIKLPKREGD